MAGNFSISVTPQTTDVGWFYYEAYGRVLSARNNSRPDRPVQNLAIALIELRDIARLLKVSGDTLISKGASAYLSYEFGWKPIISDLRKLVDLQASISKRFKFLLANSGKTVKRERVLYEMDGQLVQDQFVVGGDPAPRSVSPPAGTYYSEGKWTARAVYHTSFKYEMPDVGLREPTGAEKRMLSGLNIDLSVLWNVLPWSWLIDWFSTAGDLIEDKLASRLVELTSLEEWLTIEIRLEKWLRLPVVSGSGNQKPEGSQVDSSTGTIIREYKWRGIPPEDILITAHDPFEFTRKQQAILAALFLSKDRMKVRLR
jgi:hypothetical protein